MRLVTLEEPGRFSLSEIDEPRPLDSEAVVRVRRIGVCGTDLHAFAGRQPFFTYPRVLGHELAVTVEHVPAGESRVRPGDICAVRPFLNNPASRASRRGKPNCCEDLRVLGVHVDGGMTDVLALPPAHLHAVAGVPLDALALVEPLSIGCHAVGRSSLSDADEALVIGAGPIGLGTAQFALLTGARVTVADLSPVRLAFVEEHLPAARRVVTPTAGERFDCVFDATGSATSMRRAFDLVAAGGRLVFVGLTLEPITFDDPTFHRYEMTLLASRNALPFEFDRVIAAVASGQIDPTAWISHRLALDDVPASFERISREPGLVKALIEVS